jgi:uncharacterized protein involved in type VI secretion and phage assembly
MAQTTVTTINIGGKPVHQFSSFSLTQGIFEHHFFRLSCPAESIDGSFGTVFSNSHKLMGVTLTAQIGSLTVSGRLKFKGIITQVETERYGGSPGDVVISGYSATILLESGPHCKSWEKKAVKNIVQDVLKHFSGSLPNSKVTPAYHETLSYFVQYKETAWRFLNRLCSTFGEWLYFDGESLIVGQPTDTTIPLIYGNNLSRFSMSLQLRPASMQVMAYDYMNKEVYTSKPAGIEEKAGLNQLGKHALKTSVDTYSTQPKKWNNNFHTNKKQLDDVVNIQSAMRSSNHVRFNGSSGHPGVKVGDNISVKGQNMYNLANEEYGKYIVISVNHYADGQGNYSNDFAAIPASIKFPPVTTLSEPMCETQSALVTDNNDPKGLGRIRAKFHWMNGAEKTPWIRVTSPHGGGGKGMFFIPEIGEEVIVGFEGESAIKPYVIGTVYNGKAKTEFSNTGNDIKALQTRSGTKIIMNDAHKSILIEDPSGNSCLMDGDGNVKVVGNKTIILTTGESQIEMKKDGTINITGKKITINAKEKAVMVSKQASFTADGNSNEAKMEGVKAKVNGSAEVKVASGAKTEVSAGAQVAVKATQITLN